MRKPLVAVLAFVLVLILFTAACSPKDKPTDDGKKPQESSSPIPEDPPKPGDPIEFYQVISREELERLTDLKVLACRQATDSFGDKTGNRIFFGEKNSMPLASDLHETDYFITIGVNYSTKQPPEERTARKLFEGDIKRQEDNPTLKQLDFGEKAFAFTVTKDPSVRPTVLVVNGECVYSFVGGSERVDLDVLIEIAKTAVNNQTNLHAANTFENLERPRPGSELSVEELRVRTCEWYEKVKLGMTIDEIRTITGHKGDYLFPLGSQTVFFTDMSGKTLLVKLTPDLHVIHKQIMLDYFDYKDYARLTPASIKLDNDIDFEDMPIDEAFKVIGTPGLEIAETGDPETFERKSAYYCWFDEEGNRLRVYVKATFNEINEFNYYSYDKDE
ncbi:MAG: hypothetical protein KA485_00970 [Clostridia bacterium]|jgi:hypothetical protein|nr:hypothetical protein [Clostridia bacterium]MBP6161489.1 hypothetical protein [Clostridia bacterium]MBP6949790.1 hypothetical protein [Clostridia bacterium]